MNSPQVALCLEKMGEIKGDLMDFDSIKTINLALAIFWKDY
jgi:hypothetical protein